MMMMMMMMMMMIGRMAPKENFKLFFCPVF